MRDVMVSNELEQVRSNDLSIYTPFIRSLTLYVGFCCVLLEQLSK